MRKATSASSTDQEKANFVSCRCPGNPKLALRPGRPPLATIQEEVADKENLITTNQKKTTFSRSKPESNKDTQRAVSKSKFGAWAESTRITKTSIPTIHPAIHSAAISVSSGSKFSSASTALEKNKENPTQVTKRRLDMHSMDPKESLCRRACDRRANISQAKVLKYSQSKTSTLDMRRDAKEKQITSRSQIKMSQPTVVKHKLKPTVRSDFSDSTISSSSSGYSSMGSTSGTLKSAAKNLEIAKLDSQRFNTLTQETMSFACPSYSCSSKIPTKSSACLTGSKPQTSKSPTWEAVCLAAQMGKVALIRDTSLICENDMPFVPMEQFIQNLDERKERPIETIPVTPCSLNWMPRRNNASEFENNFVPKPAVKTTLTRNRKQRKLPLMYTPEYDEVIISYCYQLRTCFLANRVLVNTYMNKRARICVVEWILKVSNYITPEVDSVFYMSVRLFDFAVISLKLNSQLYQLAAIVAIWISAKYLVDTKLEVPKLCSFCDSKFSKQEILSMEKRLLKSTNFCLSMADPLDFLNFYLRISNLDGDEVLRYGANFVLECSAMFHLYTYTEPTFLVAASLYLAHRVINQSNVVYINFVWYEKVELEKYANDVLNNRVLYAIQGKLEPARKYSSAEKLFVANLFV